MRYEVVIIGHDGLERVVATTRRENGAINERDIYADSEYAIMCKHNEDGRGRVITGPVEQDDPNATAVVYYDEHTMLTTIITYRRKAQ